MPKKKKKAVVKQPKKKDTDKGKKTKKCDYGGGGAYRELNAQLNHMGLTLKDTAPDGNCMFRALSDQLTGSEACYHEYRAQVCAYMDQHRDDFAPFIVDDCTFDDYVRRMQKDGRWGGNMELVAASKCFGANIIIHQLNSPRLELRADAAGAGAGGGTGAAVNSGTTPTIHIAYLDAEHYSSVRPVGKKKAAAVPPSYHLVHRLDDDGGGGGGGESEAMRIVRQQTGCENVGLIERVLRDMWNDVDSTVDTLISMRTADDPEFFDKPPPCTATATATASTSPTVRKVKISKRDCKLEKQRLRRHKLKNGDGGNHNNDDGDGGDGDVDVDEVRKMVAKLGTVGI